jgi:hypothetical protein
MGTGPTATTKALRMRDSSMFYFNISINARIARAASKGLEATIRNCSGKIQPYARTDGRPTAEQPQDAPIGRLAFPGLAKIRHPYCTGCK